MSHIKQLASETVIYGISSILSRIVHFVFLTGYLTRVFTERSLYGIHQDLYAYMALLLLLFTYRMETAYFRMASEKGSESIAFNTAFYSILFSTSGFFLVLMLFRQEIASILEYPEKPQYVIYCLLIIFLDSLAAIPFARLRMLNKARRFALIKLINVCLTIFLILFFLEICPWLLSKGWTVIKYIYRPEWQLDLVILANVVSSGIILLLLWPFMPKRFECDFLLLQKMFWYVGPLILVSLAATFNQSFAVPLLKYWLPGNISENLETAAIYAAAAKLALLMNLFTQAFNYAAEPFFFKRSQDRDAQEIYANVAQAFSLVASLTMLVILLYLDHIKYLLGPNYREGTYVVPILLCAYWFLGLYYNFSLWYKIKDRTHVGALISLAGALVTMGTAAWLIPSMGMVAMAWAGLACYIFMAVSSYLTGQVYYKIPYPLGRISFYLISVLFVYVLKIWFTDIFSLSWIGSLLCSSILLGIYLFLIYKIDRKKIFSWIGQK